MEWLAIPGILLTICALTIYFPRTTLMILIFNLFFEYHWMGITTKDAPFSGMTLVFLLAILSAFSFVSDIKRNDVKKWRPLDILSP